MERADQIRGFVRCEWSNPYADPGEDVAGRTYVICTECGGTPEQIVASAVSEIEGPSFDWSDRRMQQLLDQIRADMESQRPTKH